MMDLFLDYLRYEKRSSEHTISSYKTDLEQFATYLLLQYQNESPETATAAMIRSWVADLMEKGLHPASLNRKIASLRTFYRFLRKKGRIASDPTKVISALKKPKRLPVFVEEKAMEMLFEQSSFEEDFGGLRDRCVMELLYGTGIRLSELTGLTLSNLDLSAKTIRVYGKRSKERIVPITSALSTAITHYIAVRAPEEETDCLILTDTGKAAYPVFIQRIVKKYLSEVTTLSQKSPHVLRHTYATHLLNRGADLNAIKELLGHSNLAATQIYTHNSIEKLKKTHQQAHPKA
jgi:integrase/recombinase XerC